MATRNIFIEIVYNFSATKNISKSLERFSLSDTTTDLLVIVPNPVQSDIESIRSAVSGIEITSIEEGLKQVSDLSQIRKVYGISSEEEKCASLIDSVVTRMACRDVR